MNGKWSLAAGGRRIVVQVPGGPFQIASAVLAEQLAPALLCTTLPTPPSILMLGGPGVGKELVARFLHECGGRQGAFVALNCAAIPKNLVEDELFGHVPGAFEGAHTDRLGAFRAANGGTLLLDEIGELPLSLQAKLLRVLQERQVRPLGQDREVPVNVLVVCATNRDPEEMVSKGELRADLWSRLEGVVVGVPPLRERLDEIIPLAIQFLQRQLPKRVIRIPRATVRILLAYDWPGAVRELGNVMTRAVALEGECCVRGSGEFWLLPEYLPSLRPRGTAQLAIGAVSGPTSGTKPSPSGRFSAEELECIRTCLAQKSERHGRGNQPISYNDASLKLKREHGLNISGSALHILATDQGWRPRTRGAGGRP